MLRSTILMAMLLSLSLAATLNKKEGYGGSSATYSSPTYGTSGSSYDAGSAPSSYSSGSETSYGSSAAASYNSGSSSYGSGSSSYNNAESYSSNGDSGNLYYYYYPVTNHSSPSYGGADSYSNGGGGGGGASYGAGNTNYYPPAPISPHHTDPFGGLLSLVGAIDINSLILPALLIGGVSLLLPAILNCDLELGTCVIPLPFSNGGGRNGRQMDDWNLQQATIPQMIDHAYQIYDAVSSDDQCMQRVVCELGGMMRNIRGKEFFFSVLEQFSSPSTKKQLYILREGALTSPSSNPACHKFLCKKLDNKVD